MSDWVVGKTEATEAEAVAAVESPANRVAAGRTGVLLA